ncbi:hypothetical protein AB4144_23015, partial [Rhizobiaceae sp. 2RAB30]
MPGVPAGGHRALAYWDENSTTMGVEAARIALRSLSKPVSRLAFATTSPVYVEPQNAATIHRALALPQSAPSLDVSGAGRGCLSALTQMLEGRSTGLVVAADRHVGPSGSVYETRFADGAAAAVIGDDDLLLEYLASAELTSGFVDRYRAAGIDPREIGAAWYSSHYDDIGAGKSGLPMARALDLPDIGVTRVENFCAGGTEAFRAAAYAIASGSVDFALAMGVEKLKDTGFAGLPTASRGTFPPMYMPTHTNPGNFSQLANAYSRKHGISHNDLKRAMAKVSVKSHANAVQNPRAHLRKEITIEQAMAAPVVASPLGLFDCCPVSDGAACAILTTPEIARKLSGEPVVTLKAVQV